MQKGLIAVLLVALMAGGALARAGSAGGKHAAAMKAATKQRTAAERELAEKTLKGRAAFASPRALDAHREVYNARTLAAKDTFRDLILPKGSNGKRVARDAVSMPADIANARDFVVDQVRDNGGYDLEAAMNANQRHAVFGNGDLPPGATGVQEALAQLGEHGTGLLQENPFSAVIGERLIGVVAERENKIAARSASNASDAAKRQAPIDFPGLKLLLAGEGEGNRDAFDCDGERPAWVNEQACRRCDGQFSTNFKPTEGDDCFLIFSSEFPGMCNDDTVFNLKGGDDCLIFAGPFPDRCSNIKVDVIGGDGNDQLVVEDFYGGENKHFSIDSIDMGDGDDIVILDADLGLVSVDSIDLGEGSNVLSAGTFSGGAISVQTIEGGDQCDYMFTFGSTMYFGEVDLKDGNDVIMTVSDGLLQALALLFGLGGNPNPDNEVADLSKRALEFDTVKFGEVDMGKHDDLFFLFDGEVKHLSTDDGNDYVLGALSSFDKVETGDGNDVVSVLLSTINADLGNGGDVFLGVLAIMNVEGGSGNDNIRGLLVFSNVDAGAGNDRSDHILALIARNNLGSGDDQATTILALVGEIAGEGGNDLIDSYIVIGGSVNGGSGNDIVNVLGGLLSTLSGGSGDDTVQATLLFGNSELSGGGGDDTILVALSCLNKAIDGGSGSDNCEAFLSAVNQQFGAIKSATEVQDYGYESCEETISDAFVTDGTICPF